MKAKYALILFNEEVGYATLFFDNERDAIEEFSRRALAGDTDEAELIECKTITKAKFTK